VSSRHVRRLTVAPGRGEGRALRFVPSEVPCGPRTGQQPPECHASERGRPVRLTALVFGSVLREGPCGELAPIAPAYHRPRSGGGAGTPFCPIRGAVRPPGPQPRAPKSHVGGLTEAGGRGRGLLFATAGNPRSMKVGPRAACTW
jgi:hypothetical protein